MSDKPRVLSIDTVASLWKRVLEDAVKTHKKGGQGEEFLKTGELVESLNVESPFTFANAGMHYKTWMSTYSMQKNDEKRHGDLCVVVQGRVGTLPFQGVKYFEAKVVKDNEAYSVRAKQTTMQLGNTFMPRFLYYHNEPVRTKWTAFVDRNVEEDTWMTTAPMGVLYAKPGSRVWPFPFTDPFVAYLVRRVMTGIDLDFNPDHVVDALNVGAEYILRIWTGQYREIDLDKALCEAREELEGLPEWYVAMVKRSRSYERAVEAYRGSQQRDVHER